MKTKEKSYVVFGLGKFGSSVARELARSGANVLAVDVNRELVEELADEVTRAVCTDVCDTDAMAKLGLKNMDGAVIAITQDLNASILATISCREAGIDYVLAKSRDALHTKILEKVGATKILVPENESGVRVAHSMLSGSFVEFYELSDRLRMIEVAPPDEWIGHSLRELDLRKKERINVIAVRKGAELSVAPDPDAPIVKKCTLLVIVDRKDIDKLS